MGKMPKRRPLTSSMRYRRKVTSSMDNQQPEKSPQPDNPKKLKQHRESKSPSRHFQSKSRHSKYQQPVLLKQLLWKAKTVPSTPNERALSEPKIHHDDVTEEDEEAAFSTAQRQMRKLLASEAEALAMAKNKVSSVVPSSDMFVAESSSQETQSGSEDEADFLPYNNLLSNAQSPSKWNFSKVGDNDTESAEETDEEAASSKIPMTITPTNNHEYHEQRDELKKTVTARRKLRQKYKMKQKNHDAFKTQKISEKDDEKSTITQVDTGVTQDEETSTLDIFHSPTNIASEMDPGVCRAVLAQLKEAVPCIVVGDVACPMLSENQVPVKLGVNGSKAVGSEKALLEFRQHVIGMLDRSNLTQMEHRESFVVDDSGFDGASSYDFFKRRFCEIQKCADIVYY